jgi:hypothetical protein
VPVFSRRQEGGFLSFADLGCSTFFLKTKNGRAVLAFASAAVSSLAFASPGFAQRCRSLVALPLPLPLPAAGLAGFSTRSRFSVFS